MISFSANSFVMPAVISLTLIFPYGNHLCLWRNTGLSLSGNNNINSLDKTNLFILTVVLIAIPAIVSRLLIWKGLHHHINPFKGRIINWSFFLIIYTIVGLNWKIITTQPFILTSMAIIAFVSTFLLGFMIQWIGILFRMNNPDLIVLLLLGTLKYYGLAGAIALYLFGPESALPAVVFTIFMTLYVTWLDAKNKMLAS